MVAQAEIGSNVQYEPSEVQKFFEGGRIFITGGSGFLGMLLIQKLIRDCPGISKLYVLIRHKKGKTPLQRLEEVFQDPVFGRMKMETPHYSDKIKLIMGDLEQPGLALNEDDKNLLSKEVNIIFHLAATVRFDEKIKKATSINLKATKDIINLAKTMTNLKAFLHCSTAYSFCPRKTISEDIYDMHITPDRLIQITETLNDDELEILTPKLIGDWPNTYSFTKGVTEKLIQEEARSLPIVIFRPSMVIPTVKDPVEGWINNYYGPVGIALGTGAGLIRVARVNSNYKCDMVPGDYVINNMIVSAQYVGTTFNDRKKSENVMFDEISTVGGIPIFNCISSSENTLIWDDFRRYGFKCCKKWQTIHTIWHCFLYLVPNIYLYTIAQFILHKIPAYLVDFTLYAVGKKPKLMKIYNKVDALIDTLAYFPTNEWNFKNANTQALWKSLNNTDKKLFEFSMKLIPWETYFVENFGKGLRLYMYKDPLETIPRSLKKYKKLQFAHYTLLTVLCLTLTYFVLRIFGML